MCDSDVNTIDATRLKIIILQLLVTYKQSKCALGLRISMINYECIHDVHSGVSVSNMQMSAPKYN